MRSLLWGAPLIGGLATTAFLIGGNGTAANKNEDLKAITNLPVTQVVMFSSGVGYFARSAEIEG